MRIELRGRSPLAWRIARDRDLIATLLGETAEGLDGTWIEKVASEVASPDPASGGGDGTSVLGRLGALIDDELFASPELRRQVDQDVAEFLKKLPKESRHLLGDDEATSATRVEALLREGSAELLMRIGGEGDEAERDAADDALAEDDAESR